MKKTKKLFAIFAILVFSLSLFSVTAFANDKTLILSEDLSELHLDSKTYVKINATNINMIYDGNVSFNFQPLPEQQNIESINLKSYNSGKIIQLTLCYKNGDNVFSYYIDIEKKNAYDILKNNNASNYFIEDYPNFNDIFSIDYQQLNEAVEGSKIVTLEWDYYENYFICAQQSEITMTKGMILIDEYDNYYYTDSEISGVKLVSDILSMENFKAVLLEDSEFLTELKSANFSPSNISGVIFLLLSAIFLILLPLATLIVGIIFTVKSKNPIYKKLWILVVVLSVLILLTCLVLFLLNIDGWSLIISDPTTSIFY